MTTPEVPVGHIYIGDLPAAVVLAALYNNAVVKGMNTRTNIDGHMTIEQAQSILNDRSKGSFIDELLGRRIHVDFTEGSFDPYEYNRANFNSRRMAQSIITHIRHVLTPALLAEATRDFWAPQGECEE